LASHSVTLIFAYARLPRSTLFPYTTLFRSRRVEASGPPVGVTPYLAVSPTPETTAWYGAVNLALFCRRKPPAPKYRRLVPRGLRSEEHTSELQSLAYLVCRLLLEKKKV